MQPLSPSPNRRVSFQSLRDPRPKAKSSFSFKSPVRKSVTAARTSTEMPSTPSPSPSPRQSLVYGPLTTTSVTTIVREEGRTQPCEGTPEKMIAPISSVVREGHTTRSGSRSAVRSSSRASSAQRHTTPTSDELRELRQTRSLFLCGRGLLSLRHIQHLPDMLSLRFLSVHMNAIKTLEAGCLRTLRHLVELDLSANELQDLPSGCWAGLGRLERLNLSSNLLTRLGPSAFKGLSSLQWLSLGFNDLVDITGLCSVPDAAPLSYVDLCSNRISTVEEVEQALAPHRDHLREIRLASPSASAAAPDATLHHDSAGVRPTNSYWHVQENALCGGDGGQRADAAAESDALARSVVHAAAPSPPVYVQRLLLFFPHLMVVNGVSYGVDPLESLTPLPAAEEREQQSDGDRTEDADKGILDIQDRTRRGWPEDNQEKLLDASDDFVRLLLKPLPRLSSPSSPSSRSTSPCQTTSPISRHTSRRASRYRHRRHTKRSHSRRSSRSRSQKRAAEDEATQTVTQGANSKDSNSNESNLRGSPTARAPFSAPLTALVHPTKQHHSAHKPRRATLRGRSVSASASTLSHTSSVTASPSIVLPMERTPRHSERQPQGKQQANAAVTSSPHIRQLLYDGDESPRGNDMPNEEGAAHHRSPELTQVPPSDSRLLATEVQRPALPSDSRLVGISEKQRLSSTPGTAAARPLKQSVPGLSPSGITDASDLSPSPGRATARRPTRVSEEVDALYMDMSDSESVGRSSDTHPAGGPQQAPSPQAHVSGNGSDDAIGGKTRRTPTPASHRPALSAHQVHSPSATTAAAAAATPRTSQATRRSSSTTLHSYPTVSSTSPVVFQWKPKRISRGTSADLAEMPPEAEGAESAKAIAAALEQVQSEMNARVEQLQEQLALRTTTIADLRHHLDLTRSQYVETQREAQQQQQQLRGQVAALKDELARRGEEASILQRKQQAQLNRAVESVKAEWSRRLKASEERSTAVQTEEIAKRDAELSLLKECKVQLQQTCTMKSAQLATLERQVQVMEEDMEGLRQRAVAHRQHTIRQANLFVAEADERRQMEAAAAEVFLECFASLSSGRSQLEEAVLQEALLQLHEVTETMYMQLAAYTTQAQEYEEALQHATSEVQQLREAQSRHAAETRVEQLPPEKEVAKSSNECSVVAPPALASENGEGAVQGSVLVSTPTPTPAHTPPLPSCTALVVSSVKSEGTPAPTSPPPSDPNDTISVYWREVSTRAEAQLRRVEAALEVATTTQKTLANENTRLLRRVEELETDQANARAEYKSLEKVAAQEKENLLRTLHTLRADMEKKDGALDALEEEARAKLNEKRQRIAELEEQADALASQHARATELNLSYHTKLEAAQRSLAEAQKELGEERSRHSAEVQQQTSQVPEMERRLRELSELLATRAAQAHQHELEKKTLVSTLTVAREQLVRLQESNTYLASSNADAKEQLAQQQIELDAARQQLRDTQEATRAKQRATLEALSRLMTADAF
ncbi:hypothetical protein ABL78_2574 [Leptomonas seymouri]|uniref:Leucine-rich repeat protein n=1 Tax=Leptomonas seymouri TaxID=5684 RepID=A0A0N1PF82_LEPSE|nr:hypothetical protein ABL78_2574 [Leptomonas seymouri]|eukprot:KPI88335.1 hypothetical protein ABL78_2574 [Leptomonas seymouri]